MSKVIAVAADHGGFSLKDELVRRLAGEYKIMDLGAGSFNQSDDYPDYAFAVAEAVVSGKASRGILICGSGAGACIAANKIIGVRAGVCHDTYTAHQAVEHDDMNILCLGARVVGVELAAELAVTFLKANFKSDVERYVRRLEKVKAMERQLRK